MRCIYPRLLGQLIKTPTFLPRSHLVRRIYVSSAPPMETVREAVEGVKDMTLSQGQKISQPMKEKKEKKTKKKGEDGSGDGRPVELNPPPEYIQHRIKIFEAKKAKFNDWVAQQRRENINVTLDNGRIEIGKSWETTPGAVARSISKSLFERTVVAKVDGELWDLERPFEKDCRLELIDFEHPEGKKAFWHSSAHILGEAAERRFGSHLCIGPPIEDGFYYEMGMTDETVLSQADYKPLESIVARIVKEKQPFERLTLSKEELLEMFQSNKYKQHIIKDKIPDGTNTTVYRCGPLIDLCRGPHVPHTGRIKAFQVMRNSASYFLGDAKNDSLQRLYGVSFPDKKLLDEHLKYLEEAAKRDHRKIGKEQELFFFHELSPGSCFFLPHGTIIYNTLQSFLRSEYWKRGYQEVMTPNMYNSSLWKRSGHWQHYKDDMFNFEVEKDLWALKPMNCPGHCLLFAHRERSYRELPMRIADFGILHRNEASGALTGLTRVRRFVQDDAHIFCTEQQIGEEITGLFELLQVVYGIFGFTFKMKLSTRPDKFLGDIETWDRAEEKLRVALEGFTAKGGAAWEMNPGDGAFYGPKIDITISDALKRDHQCATIQLDFQLPQRFNLEYASADVGTKPTKVESAEPSASAPQSSSNLSKTSNTTTTTTTNNNNPTVAATPATTTTTTESSATATRSLSNPSAEATKIPDQADPNPRPEEPITYAKELSPGCARPVMIHRAIYGSFERFIAILTEHFAGKWPFWLSPRQILVVPVMPAANDYVLEVQGIFRDKGMHVDSDVSGNTMQKKIRTGQLQQYNFIFVVGAQERDSRTINIRNRDDPATQAKGDLVPIDAAIEKLERLRVSRDLVSSL